MKKEIIYTISHLNPDTDSVVSAIVWANFFKRQKKEALPATPNKINKETEFVLKFCKEKAPLILKSGKGKNLFLIDHGDLNQAVKDAKEGKILGVLDHHKMSGLETPEPIYYRAEPLGSTSTLIAKIFKEQNIKFTKKEARLLICGIISDTLNLTSPTTTQEDKKILEELVKISPLEVEKLAMKMFKAKSDISCFSIEEILTKDYKKFVFGKNKVGIGVFETLMVDKFFKIKDKILKGLKILKNKEKLDYLFFGVINILKKETILFLPSEKEEEIARKVFKFVEKEKNILLLPEIVSRKKQIIPPLSLYFEKTR